MRSTRASPKEAPEIKQLIQQLATIESPDFGFSDTLGGSAFLPIDGMSQPGARVFTDHRLKSSPELRKLVELGPKSLPFLLAALDDPTPTKLVMKQGKFGGVMWYSNEMSHNPLNPTEQQVLGDMAGAPREERVDSHTVTIGDICFVAIGQIVGRGYRAVRYQPSGCTVVNSPTHDPELCENVREIWSGPVGGEGFLDSLLLDFATRDGDGRADGVQAPATTRLLFYFPEESAELIADRLDKLTLGEERADGGPDDCATNGVEAASLVRAVAWSPEPGIRAAVLRIFERATDVRAVVAAAKSVGSYSPAKVRERIGRLVDALPKTEGDAYYGDGYHLLVALGEYGGAEAKPIFRRYLNGRAIQRCASMCLALQEVRSDWAIELLAPLLDDSREIAGWTYSAKPGSIDAQIRQRVCDVAAETIAGTNPGFKFEMQGSRANLDRQIHLIKDALAKPAA